VASLTHSHHPAEYSGPRDIQDVGFKPPVRPVKGKFVFSDAPGLGLEVDESQLNKRVIRWTSSAAGAWAS
jgi:L-alanine-DL-glutamate epimerase-like enolase superfamily enzyme